MNFALSRITKILRHGYQENQENILAVNTFPSIIVEHSAVYYNFSKSYWQRKLYIAG